ncbi:hypothetical protein V495_00615 [Pseudogymnoascus sp. VKM F-4514 (FW-929)]|nr:hypothetical protein V495_00615 [Pseudogymnoascus sp. VKM F-4514 (FW-929)]KFY66040.1 hypothetical protein V497_01146 [Pseudogymnoascus sp. VKM F-4516 (FW-969)]
MYNFQHQTSHQQTHTQHHQDHTHTNGNVAHHTAYSSGVLSNSTPNFTPANQTGHVTPQRGAQTQINEHWAEQLKVYKETERAHSIMVDQHAPNYYARTKGHENRSIPAEPAANEDTEDRGRPSNQDGPIRRQDWHNMDISGQGLRVLAPPLFAYTFLNELYIGSNKITHIPASIGKLRQLRYLDASNNQLSDLPPELGMCVYLKHLLLFDNDLRTLPNELGSLYHLEMLGIEGNPLEVGLKREIMENGTKALVLHLRETAPVPMPPPPRVMLELQEASESEEHIKVFSYNTLCFKMATEQMYGYTPSGALSWDYRKEQILQEVQASDADFITLQEVDNDSFKEFFSMKLAYNGYKGVFWPKSRARTMSEKDAKVVDGCATFYKGNKWILLDKQLIDFANIAINRPDMKNQHDIFNRVMPRDNISVVTFFENRLTGARVVVVNVHIYWDLAFSDVKIIQTAILMEYVTKLADKYARWPACKDKKAYGMDNDDQGEPAPSMEYTNTQLPLLVCGDFNSTPESAVYELLAHGSLEPNHKEMGEYQYGNFTRDGMQHPFSLRSSYANLDGTPEALSFTNYTPGYTGILDYIWYSTNALEVTSLLGPVDPEYLKRLPGFPNYHFPSDHLSLLAEFTLKKQGKDRKGDSCSDIPRHKLDNCTSKRAKEVVAYERGEAWLSFYVDIGYWTLGYRIRKRKKMGSSRDLDTSDSAAEKGTPAVGPVVAPAAPGVGEDAVIQATELEVESAIEKKEEHTKASFAHFIRIFSYGKSWDFVFLVAGAAAAMGAGITLPLMNIVFGNLIGDFSNAQLYIVYLFIGKFVLVYISMFCFRFVGTRLSAAIRLDYLRALFKQSISELDKLPSGSAAQTITGGANTLQIGITDKLGTLLQFTAMILSAFIVAFKYSWQLTLVTSSVLLGIIVLFGFVIPLWLKAQKAVDYANGKATSISSEAIGAVRMIVACGAEDRVAKKHNYWVDEARKRGLRMSPLLGFQLGPTFLCIFADYALTFWYGVKLFNDGHIDSVGTILIVLMSVLISVMSLGSVITPLNAATRSAAAAAEFFAIIDKPTLSRDGLSDPEVVKSDDIKFENVTFAYPTRSHVKVLDNFNAVFEKGKLTAIVGPSGSGKSTVVGLIERWYNLKPEAGAEEPEKSEKSDEPEDVQLSGTIKMGDHDLDDINLKYWRSQIGLVQQEPFIFNDSIYANVAYGLVGTEWEDAEESIKRARVKEACEESFADEYITRLPLSYDTQVGESGMKLSGGQRQRLAIARAIVKRPQILIFDEATSSIDVRGERIVQAALDRVAKDRTTITIAHRLSTIKKADKIIVVAKGKVVEQGSHEELVKDEDGVYHNLVHAQQIIMGNTKEWEIEEDSTASLEATEVSEKIAAETEVDNYQQKDVFRSFGVLLFENRQHLPWLFMTILGSLGGGAAVPLTAFLMANVIAVFSDYPGDPHGMSRASTTWALAFVYLAIGVGLSYCIMGWCANSLSVHVANTYRQQYFEGVIHKPIKFFDQEDNSSGTLVSRLSSDPTQLQELMGTNMGFVYIAICSLTACIILSLAIGWKLALVSLVAALPLTFTAGFYRVRYEIQFEKLNADVFAESSKFASEAFGAVRTVASLTLEDKICQRYEDLLNHHLYQSRMKSRYSTLVFALSDSINMLCMALTFWYGGRLQVNGEYDIKQFLIIYTAVIQGAEAAGQWMSFGPNVAQATAAANRILKLRDVGTGDSGKPFEAKGGVEIQFKDVQYTYPTRDLPIFESLNMTIKKGQFVALVGPSGCGKSTIISLLEQFYHVQGGSILIDGQDVSELNVKEYRKMMSLVAQEATLFQGTIKENILLGVDGATDEEVFKACREAEIHEFIESLPEGYGTDIGSKGVALSGGQKQRISIARALVRNPQVLLLDEATSSLDSESEKLIQAAFEKAGKGRTMVVVAHRLATIQNADVIFVLGGGANGARVLEKGSHAELLGKKGVYYQMCQSQALDR